LLERAGQLWEAGDVLRRAGLLAAPPSVLQVDQHQLAQQPQPLLGVEAVEEVLDARRAVAPRLLETIAGAVDAQGEVGPQGARAGRGVRKHEKDSPPGKPTRAL